MKVRRRASVTCFMGMNLMFLLSLFFTLLEMLHYYSLKRVEPLVSQIAIESAFADYNRPLWKNYGILAIDASYGTKVLDVTKVTDRMASYQQDNAGITSAKNASHGVSFLRMASGETSVTGYGLLTDSHGVPFMQLAAKQEVYETTGNVLGLLSDSANAVSDLEGNGTDVEGLIADGSDALSDAADVASGIYEDGESLAIIVRDDLEDVDNPIDTIGDAMREGWLSLVIPEGRSLSEARFAEGERVSKRTLNVGAKGDVLTLSAMDKLLYLKFLLDHYSNFAKVKNHGGLQYELEYMVGGKTTDEANLTAVVNRLMALREASNFASICADAAKMAEAEALAIALVGFTGNPAIIEATKWGIVAAWASAESVVDLRALLEGKRIAAVKSPADWTLDLWMIAEALSGKMSARECASGLTYEEYLYGFLLLKDERTLGLRGLDVLEDVLHHTDDYKNVRMDAMIYCMDVTFSYEAAPLFLSFVVLLHEKPGAYRFERQLSMTYID